MSRRSEALAVYVDRDSSTVVIRFRYGTQILEAVLPADAAHEFFHAYTDAFSRLLDLVGAPDGAETPPPPGVFDHGGPYEAALKKRLGN